MEVRDGRSTGVEMFLDVGRSFFESGVGFFAKVGEHERILNSMDLGHRRVGELDGERAMDAEQDPPMNSLLGVGDVV